MSHRRPLPVDSPRKLTFTEALDFNLQHSPDEPFYVFSRDDGAPNTTITHLEFTRAAHRAAYALRPNREGEDRKVVAIIAILDAMTYQAVNVGLIIAGYITFAISPRLAPAAVVHLLKKMSCHQLITSRASLSGLLDGVKAELAATDPDYDLLITEAPVIQNLYPRLGVEKADDPFQPYPSPEKPPSLTDVAIYLHSSGSTGFPKVIPETHLSLLEWGSFSIITDFIGHDPPIRLTGVGQPSFHTLGIYAQLMNSVYGGISVSIFPPVLFSPKDQPIIPTPDIVLRHIQLTQTNGMIVIPAMINAWSQSEANVNFLKTAIFVGYSGGPVPKKIGDYLASRGVNLNAVYGGTEFGAPSLPQPERGREEDWEWVEFSPMANVRWVDEGDGKYECQFLTCETHHPAVENMVNPSGYATSDLFEKHPTKPNLWKIVGRKDDVIMHSTGEKTVPGPMEEIISSSPITKGVVMFGRERDQAGILIEPTQDHVIDPNDHTQLAHLRNKIWPVIEEANIDAPAYSRIFKEMILISSPQKPLPRSAKGTVSKKEAVKVYTEEIDELYKVVESSKGGDDVIPPDDWEERSVKNWILDQAQEINSGKEILPSKDLFEQGFDSLSATFLRLRVSSALSSSKSQAPRTIALAITQNIIYTYPTVDALADFVSRLVIHPTESGEQDRQAAIDRMIEKYSSGLEVPISPTEGEARSPPPGSVVLLTGSTGNLGSEVLANLLQEGDVKKVYALNRSSGIKTIVDRHKERFEDKGLDVGLLASTRLTFVEGDSAEERLGLDQELYEELRTSVTLIIHTAWRLDFNLTLASFEPNIRGTRHLIDLARSSPHPSAVRFLFTSSISAAQAWDRDQGMYPEKILDDAKYAVGGGYGEGKYVSERIIAKSGLQASSLRINQISGGLPNGAWAISDWVPILVKSSLALGALPRNSGVISWVPMDVVCKAIIEIAFSTERIPLALNLSHPLPVKWDTIISGIAGGVENLKPEISLNLIPITEWVDRLEKRAKNAQERDLQEIPAIKLLEFFRGMSQASTEGKEIAESGGIASFKTDNVKRISRTMNELKPIGLADVERWLGYWKKHGLF